MSYILEALKKAQAERQLGATPTIHAPTLDSGVIRNPSATQWKPLALAAGAVLAAGALALLWRQMGTPETVPAASPAVQVQQAARTPVVVAPASVPTGTPVDAAVTAAQPVAAAPAVAPAGTLPAVSPTAATPLTAPPPSPARAGMPAAAPAAAQAAMPAAASPAAPLAAAQVSSPRGAAGSVPAVQPAPQLAAKSPGKPAQAPAPAEPQEEPVQWLRELPEPIQRSIPAITMGGYMYSKNPADRLLLIDKALRHEGEEVAPGLVLEKLQPKAAVFTFKGYRYRVPY